MKLIWISFLFIIGTCVSLLAQGTPNAGESKDTNEYKINVRFPLKVYTLYKMTDSITVKRMYSDSTTKEYSRAITYYFTHFNSKLPEDGFNTVNVTVDSMEYRLSAGDKSYYFWSQADDLEIPNILDFSVFSVPLGRSFDVIYSPYIELAKIEGEELDELKHKVLVEGKGILDTLKKSLWIRGFGDERLAYIADMIKNLVPLTKYKIDSTWTRDFRIQLDGINFYDNAEVKIVKQNAGELLVNASLNNLMPKDYNAILFDINKLVEIDSGKVKGNYTFISKPNGLINSAEANFEGIIFPRLRNESFEQHFKAKIKWEVIKQHKW